MRKLTSPVQLDDWREEIEKTRKPVCVAVCAETGCLACGAEQVARAFEDELEKQELRHRVEVRRTGCHGFCEQGPIVVIFPERTCYLKVRVKDVPVIVSETLMSNKAVRSLLFKDPATEERIAAIDDIPFFKHQKRIIHGNNSLIDARRIEDYIVLGGYKALAKALHEMTPPEVIDTVRKSGLRGRGGGGFLTGVKWESARNAPGTPRYVIVNADEGDPGAFMDRSLLEGNPHGVIEGLIIGAYAIGSHEGYIYVREEYPRATENTELAVEQARECGLLGRNILGSGFDFDVTIHRGAGAFVSGESSALMSAIQGEVGEPRPKYIHTVVKGLWDKPTCLNNVETWANVPFIITRGHDWFRSIGTGESTGTKIFSLVGKVRNTGLVEVPMGTTLREIVYDIGGGIPHDKAFKAVQTGGPSGGVLPEEKLDLPVDFDVLTQAGSMMGSGGMIVMDEDTCMVDTARYYTRFLAHESCGKCVPCREGLRQMLRILDRIAEGAGREGDIELLEELGEFMQEASLCALGKSAANPVLSAIRYFRGEFEAHIRERRCPAGVCKDLFTYYISPENCVGCGVCAKNCPTQAIEKTKHNYYEIKQEECIKCGSCLTVCPETVQAIRKAPVKDFSHAV